jgi:hypothetical protein
MEPVAALFIKTLPDNNKIINLKINPGRSGRPPRINYKLRL